MQDETTPQDSAAMSPASTGSVDEPTAWGVLRVGGGWVSILADETQAETSRKSLDARENWVHEVVPLYRSPTLTPEEREAIAYFAVIDGPQYLSQANEAAAIIRALLERTK